MTAFVIECMLAVLSPDVNSLRGVLWIVAILVGAYFIAPIFRIEIRREHV